MKERGLRKRKLKMTVKPHRLYILLVTAVAAMLLTMTSCSDNTDHILSEGALEDILFDYHLADGMARSGGVDSITSSIYFNSVLKKHGVTQAEFDSTMIYYMSRANKLRAVYERLSVRFENEARLQGLDGSDLFAGNELEGDTGNVWKLEREKVFTTNAPNNLLAFYIEADSTYKPGDRLVFSFKTDFLYQDGSRNGYAVMSVKLKNDSVITRSASLVSTNSHNLDIRDVDRKGIKEVRGFIMHRKPNVQADRNSTTLRIMVVSDMRLIKMHTEESKPVEALEASVNVPVENATMINDQLNNNIKELKTDEKANSNRIDADSKHSSQPGMH